MKTLHIAILDKKATYRERDGVIVCGNSDYVIEFTFDNEWEESDVKTARFSYNGAYQDVVFTGNAVEVPILKNITSVDVGVFAGNLSTTTPATIPCEKSILCDDGMPETPSDDVYAQIIEKINEMGTGGDSADLTDYYNKTEVDSALSGKVDKSDTHSIIYGTDINGNQTTWNYRYSTIAKFSVAGRDGNGNIPVATAVHPQDATNKKYVDDATKLYRHSVCCFTQIGIYEYSFSFSFYSKQNTQLNINEALEMLCDDASVCSTYVGIVVTVIDVNEYTTVGVGLNFNINKRSETPLYKVAFTTLINGTSTIVSIPSDDLITGFYHIKEVI